MSAMALPESPPCEHVGCPNSAEAGSRFCTAHKTELAVVPTSPQGELIGALRSPKFVEQIRFALPEGVTPERFVRIAVTAVQANPDIAGVNVDLDSEHAGHGGYDNGRWTRESVEDCALCEAEDVLGAPR